MEEFETHEISHAGRLSVTMLDSFIFTSLHLFTRSSTSFPHPSTAFPALSPPPNYAIPILVYGAGSTTGQYLKYALQLLHAAGHTHVATTSPKHHAFLSTLGAMRVFSYASATLTADVAHAVGGGKVALALDAITVEGT
jgi:NADPH:quinone reductase-like Zn-dependent oxidoreductase